MSSTARVAGSHAVMRAIRTCRLFDFVEIHIFWLTFTAHGRTSASFMALPGSHLATRLRNSPVQHQTLAILVPNRNYSTETTTHDGAGGRFPPPGFNAQKAKRPLPQEPEKKSANAAGKPSVEKASIDQTSATAVDKTKANEQASLSELATERTMAAKADEGKMTEKKEESKKLTLGQKIRKEVRHYWDGTKLLATEVRISSKLALKMAAGYELSRRENRQVRSTSSPAPHI